MRAVEEHDFIAINEWLEGRKASFIPYALYPEIGLIEEGVAAGFLTLTDTRLALMENFVSNPKADGREREKAIMAIIEELERIGSQMGYKYVVGITSDRKMEHYIGLAGGKPLDVKLFGKEI